MLFACGIILFFVVGSSRSKSNCSKTAFSVWTIFSTFFVRVNWITKYNWATIVPQYVYTKCTFPDGPEAIMSFLVFTLSFVFVSLSLRKVFFWCLSKILSCIRKQFFFLWPNRYFPSIWKEVREPFWRDEKINKFYCRLCTILSKFVPHPRVPVLFYYIRNVVHHLWYCLR